MVRTDGRRRFRPGFRARVLGFAAVMLIVVPAVGLAVQRAVLLERLDRNVNAALDQEREELEKLAAGRNPATSEAFRGDVAAIFDTFLERNVPETGEVFLTFVDSRPYKRTIAPISLDSDPELVERWAGITAGERAEIETSAGPARFLAVPLASGDETRGVFVVARFLADDREAIDTELRVQAGALLVVVSIALGVAWLTAGRLLRPLRDVTDTARSIGDTDLSRRIPVQGEDEVAEMADTFNDMLDRLETAFDAQRAFVDDAGHELRTPITVIMGQLELMGDDPDDRARTLAVVDAELGRMARIVEDLLLLAKAERPDFVRPEPVELTDLTTELVMKARTLGGDWRLEDCAEGTLMLDPQRITQAVLNLVRNAVEHAGTTTTLGLGSRFAADRLHLWVRDEGPGIAADERRRIFDRFARGSQGRRRSEGAGLGLAIVSAVAAGHGGTVRLDSEEGEGSTFTLDLPAVSVPNGPDGAGPDPSADPERSATADPAADPAADLDSDLDPTPPRGS